MNLAELGSLLKRERERRGLSVRDVMDATKISRRNLNALEAGEVRFLPHPVYLKGYVRNYAKLIGLDAEPLVAVVDEQSDGESGYVAQASPAVLAPELPVAPAATPAAPAEPPSLDVGELPLAAPQPVSQDAPRPAAPHEPGRPESGRPRPAAAPQPLGPQAPKSRSNLRSLLVLLVLVAALGGALYYYQQSMRETPPPAPAPAAASVVDNASETANATQALPAENATAEPAAVAPAPEATPAPVAPAARTAPSAPSASVDPAAPAVAPGPSGSVPASSVEVTRKASPTASPAAQPATQPAQPAPEVFGSGQDLVITAKPGELCWMELSDGQKSKSFILRNGESRKVEFGSKLRVRLGNSGGVTFRLNGEMHPFAGERGQKQVVDFGPR